MVPMVPVLDGIGLLELMDSISIFPGVPPRELYAGSVVPVSARVKEGISGSASDLVGIGDGPGTIFGSVGSVAALSSMGFSAMAFSCLAWLLARALLTFLVTIFRRAWLTLRAQ